MRGSEATTLLNPAASERVIYNRESKKVEIAILGSRSSVDGAKETLDEFRQKAMPMVVGVVQAGYGVQMDDDQLAVIYLNHWAGNKETARRENGQYIVH